MNIFDLHCDTVSTCIAKRKDILENDLHISLNRGLKFDKWVQTFAFWIPDTLRGEKAFNNFVMQHDFISNIMVKHSDKIEMYNINKEIEEDKCYAIFSIEGGAALAGNLDNIYELKKRNVCMMTLCWNDNNEIAGGVYGDGRLTDFGKSVIKEMENNNIIVDVSHLNIDSFWDVCNIATKPLIATHSNSYDVLPHKRNLKKDQIQEIIKMKGLIGINFYTEFVSNKNNYDLENLILHIDEIMNLGGEDVLALGSDFDGADMPECLDDIEKLYDLNEILIKEYGNTISNKILFDNANNFMVNNM